MYIFLLTGFVLDRRSYGVAWAAATQWFWNFVVSYVTPLLVQHLSRGGVFFFFAAVNIVS